MKSRDMLAYAVGLGAGTVVFLALELVSFAIGAVLWTYSIDSWALYFGHAVSIPWYAGGVLGIIPVVGQASIPVAAVTWVLMMIL